jgi:peptidoglycan/LPS O-acetylase OafA/YrhL
MGPERTDARQRNRALDGLRALAALSVVGYHVASFTGHSPHSLVFAQLKAGVAVFFVISGFVLYTPWARGLAAGGPLPSWRAYATRRVARIVPGFWVALSVWVAVCAAAGASGLVGRVQDLWRYYGFVQTYGVRTLGAGYRVSWSMCVELAFYLVLPLLAMAVARLAALAQTRARAGASPATIQLVVFALLAVASFDLRLGFSPSMLSAVPVSREVIATSLPAMFDWFAIGLGLAVCAAQWEHGAARGGAVYRLAGRPGMSFSLGGLLFALATPLQGGDLFLPIDSPAAHLLIGLAAGLLVLGAIAPARLGSAPDPIAISQPRRAATTLALLGSRPMAWLGTISYGIYLYHLLALMLLRRLETGARVGPQLSHMSTGPSLVLLASTVAAAVGLGAGSWYLIERPANRRALRWLAGSRQRRIVRAATTPA